VLVKKKYEKRIDQQTLYKNLKDFSVNNEIITSTSDDPWIFLDTSDIGIFKYIKIEIKLYGNGNNNYYTQYFYATKERGFNGEDLKTKKIKNGINYIKIPEDNYIGLRLDLTNIEGISFLVKYVELTNKYIPKLGEIFLIIILNIIWCGFWFIILFNKYLINSRIIQILIRKYEWLIIKITLDKSLYLYIFFCFILYSVWSLITPFNGAPDESMRWSLLLYIKENLNLPMGGEPSIRNALWGISYAYLPYISTIIGAIFLNIAEYYQFSSYFLLYAGRLPVIMFSVATIFFTYKIGQRLFNNKAAWFLVILFSMWPEYAMISSYLNNDVFALFTVSIIIYSWIYGTQNDWDWKSCTLLAIGVGLCFISYYNAFGFILLSVILWILSMVKKREKLEILGQIILKTVYIITIVFIIAGWWYIRNAYLYNGDFLGMKTSLLESEKYAIDRLKPSNRQNYLNQGKSIYSMLKETPWVQLSTKSFIALFGYMNIPAKSFVYNLYFTIILIGFISTIIIAFKSIFMQKTHKNKFTFYLFITLSIPIPVILSIYNSFSNDFQPQGRYLLPMLISLCILITSGFEKLNNYFHRFSKLGNISSIIIFLIFIAHISCFYTVFLNFHPLKMFYKQ
jgi:hypothetical protein